jgi:hypothetical protein
MRSEEEIRAKAESGPHDYPDPGLMNVGGPKMAFLIGFQAALRWALGELEDGDE